MKHQHLSKFEFGEFVDGTDAVGNPLSVGAKTRISSNFDPERGSALRIALRFAQDIRDALKSQKDRVTEALARVKEMSVALERELDEFRALDAEIGENCVAQILRSIDNGEEPKLDLSPELQKMSDQRLALERRLTAARQAEERLRRELAVTEHDLNDAECKVENAAVAIVAFEIEPIASELAEIEQKASALRSLLLGYSSLHHGGGFLPMSHCAAKLLRGTRGVRDPSMAARWRSYLSRLATDSTATFDMAS